MLQSKRPIALQSIRESLKLKLFDDPSKRRQSMLTKQSIQVKGRSTPDAVTDDKQNSFPSPKRQLLVPNDSPKKEQPLSAKKGFSFEEEWLSGGFIGEGGHALVKRCTKRVDLENGLSPSMRIPKGKECAVKIFRTGDPEIINTIKITFNNNRLLHDSKHVIKAYDLYIDEQKEQTHLVMEYCDYPSLESLLNKRILSRNVVQKILDEMAQAIEFTHNKGICHRDLKPDNILVRVDSLQQVELKIIDFGVSKKFLQKTRNTNHERDMWTRTGCIFYQAPEIFEGGGYNKQIDIWSIGVMLYQMLCRKLPYQAETIMDTIALISEQTDCYEQDLSFSLLPHLEQDLIRRLLKRDPLKRLTASELRLHPWLKTSQASQSPTQYKTSFDDTAIQQFRPQEIDMAQSSCLDLGRMTTVYHPQRSDQKLIKEEENEDDSPQGLWDFTDHIHYVRNERATGFKQFSGLKLNRMLSDKGNSEELHQSSERPSQGEGSPSTPLYINIELVLGEENIRRESLEFLPQKQYAKE